MGDNIDEVSESQRRKFCGTCFGCMKPAENVLCPACAMDALDRAVAAERKRCMKYIGFAKEEVGIMVAELEDSTDQMIARAFYTMLSMVASKIERGDEPEAT